LAFPKCHSTLLDELDDGKGERLPDSTLLDELDDELDDGEGERRARIIST
jgi:hypothetical protein